MPRLALLGALLCAVTLTAKATIHLELVDRIFLANANNEFKLGEETVKRSVYSPVTKYIYAVGVNGIRVIDAADPYNLKQIAALSPPDLVLHNVVFEDNHILLVKSDANDPTRGLLFIDREFDGNDLVNKQIIEVCHSPLGIGFANNKKGKKIVIGCEGLSFDKNGKQVDQQGSIVIVDFEGSLEGPYTLTTLTFEKYNDQLQQFKLKGFRCPGEANGKTLNDCAEPRDVVISDDSNVAYVVMQHNNAIVKVSLRKNKIVRIAPLGTFPWDKSFVDFSDKDGGFNLNPHPVRGMFMPDGVAFVHENGKNFLALANEGTMRKGESARGKNIVSEFASSAKKRLINMLQDKTELGRLFISTTDGRNQNGRLTRAFGFGARSFSIRAAATGRLLFDTDDQFERHLYESHPQLFNSKIVPNKLVSDTTDTTSDERGVEPDSIVVCDADGTKVIVTGCESPGLIFVYKYGKDITKPKFQSVYSGIERSDVTWNELYAAQKSGDLNLKVNQFIPANKSPTGTAVILVTGSASNSVSLLKFVHIP